MRKAYVNGVLFDAKATAFIVDDGKFVLFGSDEEILRLALPSEVTDLKGAFVTPGMYAMDVSLLEIAESMELPWVNDRDSLLRYGEKYPSEKILVAYGDDKLERKDVEMERPVVLKQKDGYTLNCAAMDLAQFEDGAFGVDFAKGKVKWPSTILVDEELPAPRNDHLEKNIEAAAKYLGASGYTHVATDDFNVIFHDRKRVIDLYDKMTSGKWMGLRIEMLCSFEKIDDFVAFLDEGRLFGDGDERLRIAHLRLREKDAEERRLFALLGAKFNTPTLIDDGEDIHDLYKECVYEGNPLGHGIVSNNASYMDKGYYIVSETVYDNPLCVVRPERFRPNALAQIIALKRQGVSQSVAIRAMSQNPARMLLEADSVGFLKQGFEADFCVFSDTEINEETIVQLVVCEGKTVYQAK